MLTKPLMRIFLLGNAVHEKLIPLLSENTASVGYNSGIVFIRNNNVLISDDINFCIFQSQYVPYNTQLKVLPHDISYEDIQFNTVDSIFIVDSWAVGNDESRDTAEKIRQAYPYTELRIILFISDRKTLSTDISTEQMALDKIVTDYEKIGFSVTIIHQQDISRLFFWKNRKYDDMLKSDYKKKLRNAKNSMAINYDLHYGLFGETDLKEMLNHEALDQFTRYDEEQGSAKIKKIVETSMKSFFIGDSFFAKEIYKIFTTFTKEVCLWEENRVFYNLMSVLTQRFITDMKKNLPLVNGNLNSKILYHNYMCETKFAVKFGEQCNLFFNVTAKNITKRYIEILFVRMEELLNE